MLEEVEEFSAGGGQRPLHLVGQGREADREELVTLHLEDVAVVVGEQAAVNANCVNSDTFLQHRPTCCPAPSLTLLAHGEYGPSSSLDDPHGPSRGPSQRRIVLFGPTRGLASMRRLPVSAHFWRVTMFDWRDKTVLITGGTGSFGKQMTSHLLTLPVKKVIIFSRDELKQHEMQLLLQYKDKRLRWFIGDVRDRDRLHRAFDGVDVIIHAAALKQVPACEYNPFEAIRTNVIGAQNIIDAAIDRGVQKVLALSTDKACNPVNLYGATKLCSDKLFIAGNHYAGPSATRFACVRYGNVVGSRGSVVPLFIEQGKRGKLTITHPDMTRFWITLDQGVAFVAASIERMVGGELFVPKIPTTRVDDLARAIAPEAELEVTGIRPGEKMHEVMISEDDARMTLDCGDHFVIQPEFGWWQGASSLSSGGTPVPDNFRYASDSAGPHLSVAEIRTLLGPWLAPT